MRSNANLYLNSEISFTPYFCGAFRREHEEVPRNYSEKTEIFVLIMLLLLSPFACGVFLYDELSKKPNFIPKLALPSTREKMTFSSINDTLLSAKI